MNFFCRFATLSCLLSLSASAADEVVFGVDFDLSEGQKQEILAAPRELFLGQPSEHLQRALESQEIHYVSIYVDEESELIHALYQYNPMTISETREFEPGIVCEAVGDTKSMAWNKCWDNSDTYITLPGLNKIQVNADITEQQVLQMLAVLDAAALDDPSPDPITSDDVHLIMFRGPNVGIYAVSTNMGITNLRPVSKNGIETYEVTEYSCGQSTSSSYVSR